MANIDSDKLIQHLENRWKNPCPMCNAGDWNVSDRVYALREYHSSRMETEGGRIIPIVPVTCSNCGNTVLVNSIIAGVTDQGKEDGDE